MRLLTCTVCFFFSFCCFFAVIPTLQLDLGSNLNPEDIEEGDDVYFECKVHANPAAYKVVWKHNVSNEQQKENTRFIGIY